MRERDAPRRGQVLLEAILVLPIFLTLVFGIMEVGHLCFWEIVLNHGTFEAARIASLVASPVLSCNSPTQACRSPQPAGYANAVQSVMGKFITSQMGAQCTEAIHPTLPDPQAGNMQNNDLVVTCSYCVSFIFPTSHLIPRFANCPPGVPIGRTVTSTIRMPIEEPVTQ